MTMIDVREAPAGPAMDAACAEAMGWHLQQCKLGEAAQWLSYFDEDGHKIIDKGKWHPSEPWSIREAWMLVEALQADDYIIKLWSPNAEGTAKISPGSWEIAVWKAIDPETGELHKFRMPFEEWDEIHYKSHADTAPLAICRAFLLAHGITEVETE